MRVFVTGGTGFVGSAVVRDLIAAGHDVLALARSAASAEALQSLGATPHVGSLEDLDSLRTGAASCDGVIHTAFDNTDLSRFADNGAVERSALRAIGDVIAGSERPLVVAGGFASVVPIGPVLTEDDESLPGTGPLGRNVEAFARILAEDGVTTSVVRLPTVHGSGDRFTLPRYIAIARSTGRSAYVPGTHRLPAVHQVDAAAVFRLAVERAEPGARYHAVGEEAVEFATIAEIVGRRLELPVVELTPTEAWGHFGLYGALAIGDTQATSDQTRARLGWQPSGPSLADDLDRPEYFAT
jgi:nucleoside-diphosphate-sugar epimerase